MTVEIDFALPPWPSLTDLGHREPVDSRSLPHHLLRPGLADLLASHCPAMAPREDLRPLAFEVLDPSAAGSPPATTFAMTFHRDRVVVTVSAALNEQDVMVYRASLMMTCLHWVCWDMQDRTLRCDVSDFGRRDALSFCGERGNERFLIPDVDFIRSTGHLGERAAIEANDVQWAERRPVLLWRGSATPHGPDRVYLETPTLVAVQAAAQRIKLCGLARRSETIDAGLTSLQYFPHNLIVPPLHDYVKEFVPSHRFNEYKYQLDVDGWSNSWQGFYVKLLTGSPVLKVGSPRNYRQWYYGRLVPWTHFIPIAADLSDLEEIVDWCMGHDEVVRTIGRNGQAVAAAMTFASETAVLGEVARQVAVPL